MVLGLKLQITKVPLHSNSMLSLLQYVESSNNRVLKSITSHFGIGFFSY